MLAQIKSQLEEAMRSRAEVKVRTLRMLNAALTNARIAAGHDLNEAEEVAVVRKEAKMRLDSIESYENAGRRDLADSEKAELAILESFLPAQASPQQVHTAVSNAISQTGATSMAQMGQVIGLAMKSLGPAGDGSVVAQEAKRQLTGQ